MKTGNKYYVYLHINPITNEIFYVGKGFGRRAYKDAGRNKYWKNYVNKHGKPKVEFVNQNISEKDAIDLEILLISKYGRRLYEKNGILVNITIGGEGLSGVKISEEQRQKHRERMMGDNNPFKGRKHSIEMIECLRQKRLEYFKYNTPSFLGKAHSEETKRKLSMASTGNKNCVGRIISKETREKISKNNIGKKMPMLAGDLNPSKRIEVREKISKARLGKCFMTPETLERKRKEFTLNNPMKNPDVVEKSISKRRGVKNIKISERQYKSIYQFTLEGKLICKYISVKEASLINNFDLSQLAKCARGVIKSSYGYKWNYEI